MARQFQGAHEVCIPIAGILEEYAVYADEIRDAVVNELLLEIKANAAFKFDDHTGNLRKSIKKKKSKLDRNTVIVGAFAPHSHLVEFGSGLRIDKRGKVSGHMPATPFLRPSEEAVSVRLPEIINSVVAPAVKVGK